MKIFIIAIVSYFIGNISPAIIIGKLKGVDIRKEGSGNAGTTNVIRVLGLKYGLATLVIDVLKGFIAVEIGLHFGGETGAIFAFSTVVLGHCFPALYHFSGGKGVATTLGCALALCWQAALISFGIAVLALLISRRMSVGSLFAAIIFPVWIYIFSPNYTLFTIILAVFILVMHRENIGRLIRGEEKKLSFGKKK